MTRVQTRGPGRAGRRRGAAVLETAIILPVVLIFLLGTVEAARLIYAYDTVAEAARCGARYAMVHGSMASSPVGPTANDATLESVTKGYAPALESSKLTVTSTWPDGSNDATSHVTVTVTYAYQPIVSHLIGLGSINVQGSTTMLITH